MGRTVGPIQSTLREGRRSLRAARTTAATRAAGIEPPAVGRARRRLGPFESAGDRLPAAFLRPEASREMLAAGPVPPPLRPPLRPSTGLAPQAAASGRVRPFLSGDRSAGAPSGE